MKLSGLKSGLEHMSHSKIVSLIKELKVIEVLKNHYLFKQGEFGNSAYVVLEGKILLFQEDFEEIRTEEQ